MTKLVANFTEKQTKEFHEPYNRSKSNMHFNYLSKFQIY